MHPNLLIANRAARKAGEIIVRSLDRLGNIGIREKKHNDFVTEVDIKAEQAIVEIIQNAYPQDSFLTEEQGEIWGEDRDTIWVVDPLDGTLNFLHGFPHFAVSIAKKVHGKIEQAVIFNPVTQDVFSASRGEGATLNDRRIRVAKRSSLNGTLINANFPRLGSPDTIQQKVLEKWLPLVGAFRRTGSTALDLAYVAAGYSDVFICDQFQEWDVSAGILLVKEAGGMVTDLKGNDVMTSAMGLLATNPKLLKPCLTQLN